jgi:hypothetical protein
MTISSQQSLRQPANSLRRPCSRFNFAPRCFPSSIIYPTKLIIAAMNPVPGGTRRLIDSSRPLIHTAFVASVGHAMLATISAQRPNPTQRRSSGPSGPSGSVTSIGFGKISMTCISRFRIALSRWITAASAFVMSDSLSYAASRKWMLLDSQRSSENRPLQGDLDCPDRYL